MKDFVAFLIKDNEILFQEADSLLDVRHCEWATSLGVGKEEFQAMIRGVVHKEGRVIDGKVVPFARFYSVTASEAEIIKAGQNFAQAVLTYIDGETLEVICNTMRNTFLAQRTKECTIDGE